MGVNLSLPFFKKLKVLLFFLSRLVRTPVQLRYES